MRKLHNLVVFLLLMVRCTSYHDGTGYSGYYPDRTGPGPGIWWPVPGPVRVFIGPNPDRTGPKQSLSRPTTRCCAAESTSTTPLAAMAARASPSATELILSARASATGSSRTAGCRPRGPTSRARRSSARARRASWLTPRASATRAAS